MSEVQNEKNVKLSMVALVGALAMYGGVSRTSAMISVDATAVQESVSKIERFQIAVEKGNTDAMVNLGVCYENGDGVVQDKIKAVE